MNALNGWIISIVGIVMLTLIVDIIIPDGQTNKYIKSIMAIVTVFVIASPIPSLISGDIELSTVFSESEIPQVDGEFVAKVTQMKIDYTEERLVDFLSENGYEQVTVELISFQESDIFKAASITVNLQNLVIRENYSHINISENVIKLCKTYLGNEVKVIVINE